jgi:PTH1 family peptidyl-tRNA hydrolase
MAIERIARHYGFGPWRARFQGRLSEGRIGGERMLALKPETYMNRAGDAVGAAQRYYKLGLDRILVFHDDLDLRPGKVKVKRGGGPGGHNGLRSLDAHVGPDYWRVRLGIGHPGDKRLVHDYVLQDFAKAEAAWLERLLDAVARELPRLLVGDQGGFMSRVTYLTSASPPGQEAKAGTDDNGI